MTTKRNSDAFSSEVKLIQGRHVSVAVPAYNEERLIGETLAGMPASVDRIIVVDDASTDQTNALVRASNDDRIHLIRMSDNGGVGAAIVRGYQEFLQLGGDICVVMAGDAQMDPADLEALIAPIVADRADYTKGDRLRNRGTIQVMPKDRLVGNVLFTLMTKVASGYFQIVDSQCGYTAIRAETLASLDLAAIYPRYGVPNDILIKLNVVEARVCDVPVRAIYGEEVSGITPLTTIPKIALLLFRGFWWRIWHRYVLRDFHPLALLYFLGSCTTFLGLVLGAWIAAMRLWMDRIVTQPTLTLCLFLLLFGFQAVLFAMLMDMTHNRDLNVRPLKRNKKVRA